MTYAYATALKGFRASTLRVLVTERRAGYVWCRTADLLDAGTPLVLDEHQVTQDEPETALHHKTGFVTFG